MIAAGPNPPSSGTVASDLLERLTNAGECLPAGVRERILELGRIVAAPALIRILETDALAEEDATGEGYAPIHAVELLQALGADEAIEPMLRVLSRCDAFEILYSKLILALQTLGASVLEPALAAHAAADSDDQRMAVEDVLSALGVRDDRVLVILLKALDREPAFAAGLLAKYAEPAALPRLKAALDACEVDTGDGLLANDDILELKWAVEALGGALSADQVRKFEEARALRATAPLQTSAPEEEEEDGTEDGP